MSLQRGKNGSRHIRKTWVCEEMEDSILAEDDVEGPDLSLDRHIAKFEFRKSCYEHSKKHAIITKNKPMCIFHVFMSDV